MSRVASSSPGDSQPRRLVFQQKEQAIAARNRYRLVEYDGDVDDQTHRQLAVSALQYYDILREYDDEPVLSASDWPDVSPIRERIGETVTRRVESDVFGEDTTVKQLPAIKTVPADRLVAVINQLDKVANKLGFGAGVEHKRTLYDAGKRDSYPDPVVDGIPKPQTDEPDEPGATPFIYSKLYHDWYQRVACGDPNDYIIAISADPRSTGVSGTGKTTLGGGLAKRWFDHSEDGFDADIQYTLDPARLAYEMYNETGELSVLVGDEMQGTPATTGLNSKRSQKSEALDAINALAAGRSDRKTVILIVQDLKSLNKDALTFIDAWLLIRDDYDYVATHYGVAPDVFDLKSRETKTPGVEELTWDALDKDDPDYQVMEQKKEDAKQGKREYSDDDGDDDEELSMPKQLRDENIRYDWENFNVTQSELAEKYGINQATISKIVNNNA